VTFKLGVYSFIYAISGLDVSWFLGLFNIFSFNIPSWVYVQYLTLYNNWLVWWHKIVKIKSLNTDSITNSSVNSNYLYLPDSTDSADNNNSWINKKNILILAGVITLIGVGIWYYFYYGGNGGAGNGGNNLPPNPPQTNLPITITDNQTVIQPGLIDYDNLTIILRVHLQ